MITIHMWFCSCECVQERRRPGCSAWHLVAEDFSDITLPSDERLASIWAEKVQDDVELIVLKRNPNNVLVEVRTGISVEDLYAFSSALTLVGI